MAPPTEAVSAVADPPVAAPPKPQIVINTRSEPAPASPESGAPRRRLAKAPLGGARTTTAVREADRAEAEALVDPDRGLWRARPAVADDRPCLNGGSAWLQFKCRCHIEGQHSARGRAEMPVLPDAAVFTAGAHDQADGREADRALCLGASRRGAVRANVVRLCDPIQRGCGRSFSARRADAGWSVRCNLPI